MVASVRRLHITNTQSKSGAFNRQFLRAAHGSVCTLPPLGHVTVKYLPPNTTSKIQPCDAGVIAAIKANYRIFQMERAIDLTETNVRDIYSVDILSAMLAFKKIWKNMNKTVISNCWRHCRILGSPERPDVAPAVNLQVVCEQISEYISELVPDRNRMDI